MSSKENNEVAVEKIADNDKGSDAKCEIKGTKRPAEVSFLNISYRIDMFKTWRYWNYSYVLSP